MCIPKIYIATKLATDLKLFNDYLSENKEQLTHPLQELIVASACHSMGLIQIALASVVYKPFLLRTNLTILH